MALVEKQIVGNLACQKDTYLRSLKATVLRCDPIGNEEFEIETSDSVIFPLGGGQPSDSGKINSVPVHNAERRGLNAIYYTKEAIPLGEAIITVDWDRRWDHVQQHSGQHLLSAILEHEHKIDTLSWKLGTESSYIEIPMTPSKDLLAKVEKRCNDLISEGRKVNIQITDERPDTLPDDYKGGVVRVIEIEGIDKNPCCGTHVSTLSHLNALKILHTAPIRGTNTRVFFVVGKRVLTEFHKTYEINKTLGATLSATPETLVERANAVLEQNKQLKHALKATKITTAKLIATNVIAPKISSTSPIYYFWDGGDMEANTLLFKALQNNSDIKKGLLESGDGLLVTIAGSAEKSSNNLLVASFFGDNNRIAAAVEKLRITLGTDNVKGGFKKKRSQQLTLVWQKGIATTLEKLMAEL